MLDDFIDVTHCFTKVAGVYILYHNDRPMYIGQSRNLITRINSHRRDSRFSFNKVLVRFCEPYQLDKMEAELIAELKPVHNRVLYVRRTEYVAAE